MTSELTVILGDFFLPSRPRSAEALPRLAALELLLARSGRLSLPGGWRSWLAACSVPGEMAQWPAARIAARAWLPPPTDAGTFWFATPVHYLAGIDSVHLHPAGLLALPSEEQTALAADFNALFGDEHWRLHALGRRELLLRGPAMVASGADPGDWAGRDPSGGAPQGADAPVLRRLGSEIEMWLHEHPLNLRRRARGALAVTGLWLWGALPVTPAATPTARAPAALPTLYALDLYAEGLWRLAGARSHALPAGFDAAGVPQDAQRIVLYPALGPEGLTALLQRLEQHWLLPGALALRQGRLRALQLVAGGQRYRLGRLGLRRFWRARSPWWEARAWA